MLDRLPDQLREGIFEKLFKTAEIAQFNLQEQMEYQKNLKQYRDLKNALDTAREEGLEEGIEKGERKNRFLVARRMLEEGLSDELIMKITGLSREELDGLKQ